MSVELVRKAIETAVAAITPTIDCEWENVGYTPVTGTPYQKFNLLLADPDNYGYGSGPFIEMGFFQLSLFYPLQTGPSVATIRADLIRSTFYRGLTLTSGAQSVIIEKTPTIGSGRVDGDRYMIPVKVRFFSHTGV